MSTQSNIKTPTSGDMPRKVNPSSEDQYWQQQYKNEQYYESGRGYGDYENAYRTGYEGYGRYGDRDYQQAEPALKTDYEKIKGESMLGWDKAKHAIQAAWHRVERALPGDADDDRR